MRLFLFLLFVVGICFASSDEKDYYEILDVPRTCGVDEVRNAYREKVNPYIATEKREEAIKNPLFHEWSTAYQVLRDPKYRIIRTQCTKHTHTHTNAKVSCSL